MTQKRVLRLQAPTSHANHSVECTVRRLAIMPVLMLYGQLVHNRLTLKIHSMPMDHSPGFVRAPKFLPSYWPRRFGQVEIEIPYTFHNERCNCATVNQPKFFTLTMAATIIRAPSKRHLASSYLVVQTCLYENAMFLTDHIL